ncbi:MAG: hypothetical protein HOP16_22175 [Acidobacteria bacterium]|nr:hypothetical protein [Acidobacteriota bacterium]
MTNFEEDSAETVSLDPMLSRILQKTQPWLRLTGIAGLTSAAFMVLAGLGGGAAGLVSGDPMAMVLLVAYPFGALLYVFPSMQLVRSAKNIREFATTGDPRQLEAAMEAQRAFWKFVGLLTLVSFAVIVLGLTAAILVGLFIRS